MILSSWEVETRQSIEHHLKFSREVNRLVFFSPLDPLGAQGELFRELDVQQSHQRAEDIRPYTRHELKFILFLS